MALKTVLQVLRWEWTARADKLAQAVALSCRNQVLDRLDGRVLTMGLPEARGYVRARSAPLVAARSQEVLECEQLGGRFAPDLVRRAGELLETMILHEIVAGHLPSHTLRRAA